MTVHDSKPSPGEIVSLTSLPLGLVDGLPQEDQDAIVAIRRIVPAAQPWAADRACDNVCDTLSCAAWFPAGTVARPCERG